MIAIVETSLFLSVAALYIVQAPFNKVEESFNTQAVHDIINLFPNNLPTSGDTSIQNYNNDSEVARRANLPWDHTQYPGVVPRTFLGALLVGLQMKLIKGFILNGFNSDDPSVPDEHDLPSQFILQVASRFALLIFMGSSMGVLLGAINKRYGFEYRIIFLLITVSQFHYMFYASRFLPNTFAAIISNLVFASWISRRYSEAIIYIAFCVIIFRFDTAIFFGWLLIDGIFIRRFLSLTKVLMVGIPAGLVAIAITFTVDSMFWARPVWPELQGLYFNLWLNKSHEWGTQPYFWYVYSCIPRMMFATCLPLILTDNRITREYFIPVLAFIFTYSFLPHKELRFILFVTPLLNLCATSGLVNVHFYLDRIFIYLNQRAKKIAFVIFAIVVFAIIVLNLLACYVSLKVARLNYPGGKAALSLGMTKELLDEARKSLDNAELANSLNDFRSNVAVYVDNMAAQTGVSRFVQVDGVYYSKDPRIDSGTFKKGYKLIYLVLEPKEISEFTEDHCYLEANRDKLIRPQANSWHTTNVEIKCRLPNQPEMYCSIVDTIETFTRVEIGAMKLLQARSLQTLFRAFDDDTFIKLGVALHIIRCGVSSKSTLNPLSKATSL